MSQPDINNHSRSTSSSFRHRIINDGDDNVVDKRVSTMMSPTSIKRYATYELNWNNFNYDPDQNNDNSAQAARWSLPNSPPITSNTQDQKQQQRSSKIRRSISPIIINTKKSDLRDKNDDEPQSPFGGITVTTVKVVEILHSPTDNDPSKLNDDIKSKQRNRNSRPEPSEDPVGIITSESSKDRKHSKQRINLSLPPSRPSPSISQIDPNMLKQKKHSSIINSQKTKGNKNSKKSELIIPKEMAFIDPRLLAINKSLVRTPSITTTNRNRKTIKRSGSFYRKKLLPKNSEFGSTSNPIYSNDPTDMEADLPPIKHKIFPWLPGPPKPPQLLHASLVPLPRVNRVAINNNHDSHIINNTLDNNNSLTPVNPKRKSKFNSKRLSRVNSQRRRTSIIEPDPNRASLIFRRQVLEESLMMSFGGMITNGVQQQPASISKPLIRRKTKKGSNAKLEDREVRRERRRREKLKLAEEAQVVSSNDNNQIKGKDNVKEFYMGPQPPPRKQSQDKPIVPSPHKPKNNDLPLLSSPPDRRLGNSNVNSSLEHSTDEPPPFPTHLARSTPFEHNSNKERSKLKQQQYSPPKGQPISSNISNNSRVIASNSERKEFNNDLSHYDIINSDETSSINQLPSPIKSQKIGKNILGLFNKQTTKDSTSPSISQISSPILRPTQLSLQSPPATPITLSSSTTPPQSPPLSPRTLKVPQQLLGKSHNGIENGIDNQNQDKKTKMEQFEALIANSETSSSKKPISGKIRAITTAITTVASSATSSASSSIYIRKKSADGTPYNSPRHSSEGSYKSEGKECEKKNVLKRDSSNRGSLTNSLADSVRYRSDELGDDGVIRVTLTPEVCR